MIVCVDLDVLLVALQLGQSEFKKLDIMIMTTPNMVKRWKNIWWKHTYRWLSVDLYPVVSSVCGLVNLTF